MILTDGVVTLELTDDRTYLFELIRKDKYNLLNDRGIAYHLNFVKYVWLGKTNGILGGVLFFCLFPGLGWTFGAYSEREKLKKLDNKGDFGYRAACLVLDWFFAEWISFGIYTVHDIKNRGAIRMSKRLGFSVLRVESNFVTLGKKSGV